MPLIGGKRSPIWSPKATLRSRHCLLLFPLLLLHSLQAGVDHAAHKFRGTSCWELPVVPSSLEEVLVTGDVLEHESDARVRGPKLEGILRPVRVLLGLPVPEPRPMRRTQVVLIPHVDRRCLLHSRAFPDNMPVPEGRRVGPEGAGVSRGAVELLLQLGNRDAADGGPRGRSHRCWVRQGRRWGSSAMAANSRVAELLVVVSPPVLVGDGDVSVTLVMSRAAEATVGGRGSSAGRWQGNPTRWQTGEESGGGGGGRKRAGRGRCRDGRQGCSHRGLWGNNFITLLLLVCEGADGAEARLEVGVVVGADVVLHALLRGKRLFAEVALVDLPR